MGGVSIYNGKMPLAVPLLANFTQNTLHQLHTLRSGHDRREKRFYFRDGTDEGRLCKVCKTFSTSPSLLSRLTFPGTESSIHTCSASGFSSMSELWYILKQQAKNRTYLNKIICSIKMHCYFSTFPHSFECMLRCRIVVVIVDKIAEITNPYYSFLFHNMGGESK